VSGGTLVGTWIDLHTHPHHHTPRAHHQSIPARLPCSVEAVSPDGVLLVPLIWQAIHEGCVGHGLVERSVKHTNLHSSSSGSKHKHNCSTLSPKQPVVKPYMPLLPVAACCHLRELAQVSREPASMQTACVGCVKQVWYRNRDVHPRNAPKHLHSFPNALQARGVGTLRPAQTRVQLPDSVHGPVRKGTP
jgi:hypothetical protein